MGEEALQDEGSQQVQEPDGIQEPRSGPRERAHFRGSGLRLSRRGHPAPSVAGLGTEAGGRELTAPLLGAHCEGRAVLSTGRVRMEGGERPKSERVKEKKRLARAWGQPPREHHPCLTSRALGWL